MKTPHFELPKAHIVRSPDGRHGRLFLDGEEFPWHISDDGITLEMEGEGVDVLYLGIIAESPAKAVVSDDWDSWEPESDPEATR